MLTRLPINSPCKGVFDPTSITGHRYRVESLVIWTFYTIVWIISIVQYVSWRHMPLIRLRSPFLSLISSGGGYVVVTSLLAEQFLRVTWGSWVEYPNDVGIVGINSFVMVLAYLVFMVMCMISYPLRALRLLFAFNQRVDIDKLKQQRQQQLQQPHILKRHLHRSQGHENLLISFRHCRNWIRSMYLKTLGSRVSEARYVTVLVILIFFFILYGIVNDQFGTHCQDTDPLTITYIIFGGLYVVIILIFGLVLILMRHVRDEFTISRELHLVILSSTIFLTPWLVLSIIERSRMRRLAFPPSYLMVIHIIFCHCVTIVGPLCMNLISDMDYEKVMTDLDKISDRTGSTLESVLHNPIASQYLRDYLVGALSSENYDFYVSATAFKEKFTDPTNQTTTLLMLAIAINDRYVRVGADEQINISDSQRNTIEITIGQLDAKIEGTTLTELDATDRSHLKDVFDPAIQAVLYAIESEHFNGFRGSVYFTKMKKELSGQDSQSAVCIEIIQPTVHVIPQSLSMTSDPTTTSQSSSPTIPGTELEMTGVEEQKDM